MRLWFHKSKEERSNKHLILQIEDLKEKLLKAEYAERRAVYEKEQMKRVCEPFEKERESILMAMQAYQLEVGQLREAIKNAKEALSDQFRR